jgi:hypothetical protein
MRDATINLTVVTATYNASAFLPRLIKSLKQQTDTDFEWVVADGCSTDNTQELLEDASKTLRVKFDSCQDFGIYDALNRAIKLSSGDYYLVLGADDELFLDAISSYKIACSVSDADLVTARIEVEGKLVSVRRPRWPWLYSQAAFVSSHAVGVAIKRDLHNRFGWYSRMLPIAADQLFILECIKGGASVSEQGFTAGRFYTGGASGQDAAGTFIEGFRMKLLAGYGFWTQLGLFLLRIVRWRIFSKYR